MKQMPVDLYLNLMKQVLAFSLWPEPPAPIETYNYRRPPFRRRLVALLCRLLRIWRLQLVRPTVFTASEREEGCIWPGYADTMIGRKRLDNLHYCVVTALNEGIEGDLIETGVWRGGACIFMRAVLAAYGVEDRRVFVADSFEGLPRPDAERYPSDEGDKLFTQQVLVVSQEMVEGNFRKYGLLDDQVVFLKGWFKDTLPNAPIDRLSVLRLDGDLYESTMDALRCLYPKLSKGGFCIIDDYALKSCKSAVDEFRAEMGVVEEMHTVDWTGRYWRKQ